MSSPWSVSPAPGTQQYGFQQNAAAYVPVQVRQSFGQPLPLTAVPPPMTLQPPPPPPSASTPIAAQPRKKIEFPQAVREYVQRSFLPHNLLDDVSRPEMEAKLKDTIATATDNNALETTDWVHLPLPQELIRQDRIRAANVAWSQQSVNLHLNSTEFTTTNSTISKKRKSQDIASATDETSSTMASKAPWRTTSNRNGFEDRVTFQTPARDRFDKRQQLFQDEISTKGTSKFQKNLEKRQRRFDGGYKSTYQASPSPEVPPGPVVGTCQTLEKRYLRLTAPPVPSAVRPEPILRQSLDLLKKKWKKEGNYSYICDQFKSMRQDLTVQRIKTDFTVTVYEIHARIALEKGDLGEYNQCQSQLRALYALKLGGNPVEFKAYRILYYIHTSNRTSLNDVSADLTTAEKAQPAIKHALDVRSSLALGNYHKFFRLYLDTPNMGAYLMDMFVVRERLAALANICKAYKPEVKLRFVTEELAFESDNDAAQFIYDYNGQTLLEEREDGFRFLTGKAGSLFETAKATAFRKVDIKGQL